MTTDEITLILVIQCACRYFFGVEYLSMVYLWLKMSDVIIFVSEHYLSSGLVSV